MALGPAAASPHLRSTALAPSTSQRKQLLSDRHSKSLIFSLAPSAGSRDYAWTAGRSPGRFTSGNLKCYSKYTLRVLQGIWRAD
ncbi:unnamed protein product [Urochloa humidicola]